MVRFSGVIPPVVTPMKTPDQLDLGSLDKIAEHLIAGGVSGLFVLGTTGEGPSLTYQMRYEAVERLCERVAGRVPVLVCVTDTCFAESVALAEHAAASGADAIVAAAPFYFEVNQNGLLFWFRQLADLSPLPLMLYNMPSCVNVVLDLATVAALSEHANIVGIKDSGGDMEYFRELCQLQTARTDFTVLMGPEERLANAVALGAAGGVCGGANLLPHLYSRLFLAAERNDAAEIRHWTQIIDDLFSSVYRDEHGQMKLIPALKLAMQECGLCEAIVAPPLSSVTMTHAQKIRLALPRLLSACHSSAISG